MPTNNENVNMQNNSTHISTLNCESVEILFGLTPYQIYQCFGCFYDLKRYCSVALMEMLQTVRQLNKAGEDISVYIELTATVGTLVQIDRMHDDYINFTNSIDSTCDNPTWLTDKVLELDCVRKLHYHLLDIVLAVDKVGFMQFSLHVAASISEVSTKQAYEDMVYALACVQNLYMAYQLNKYNVQLSKYEILALEYSENSKNSVS